MASSIKVSGAWKRLTGASVKVSGTWRTATAAYVKVAGVWKQWFAAFIIDDFNRSTSGTLGTSSSGASWSTLNGQWYANGSQAQSDTSSSAYPIATVGWGASEITASASVSGGTGISFWVTDSSNWWAVVSYNNFTTYSYGINPYSCPPCQTCYGTTTTYNCVPYNTPDTMNCACAPVCNSCPGGYTYCSGGLWPGLCVTGAGCNSYNITAVAEPSCTTAYNCACGNATSGTTCTPTTTTYSYDCNCATCYSGTATGYNYYYYLRLLKSEAGVITTVTDVALASQAAAILLSTSGDTITAKAYSDTAMTSQLGSDLVYTATSPVQGPSAGIIKITSEHNQGSTVDDLVIGL
jgi:hypothetical protein